MDKYIGFNSDDYESDSSGNNSDNDEVNMIQKFKNKMTHKEKVSSRDDESFIDEDSLVDLSEDEPPPIVENEDENIFEENQHESSNRRKSHISDHEDLPQQKTHIYVQDKQKIEVRSQNMEKAKGIYEDFAGNEDADF